MGEVVGRYRVKNRVEDRVENEWIAGRMAGRGDNKEWLSTSLK